MKRFICLILTSCLFCCCASAPVVQRQPATLTLKTSDQTWAKAAQALNDQIGEYDITVEPSDRRNSLFGQIESKNEEGRVCLPPKVHYDFAGNLQGFTPVYCTELDAQKPESALDQAIQTWQNREVTAELGSPNFRASILRESTPENPLCYVVFPDLFLNDPYISPVLEENYLIACANRIDRGEGWTREVSQKLAMRLRADAAMASSENSFIATAFKHISEDVTDIGRLYGASLEGYSDLLSGKLRQAEVTTLDALRQTDQNALHHLSYHNAMQLTHLALNTNSMNGDRLEEIVSAIDPSQTMPVNVQTYHQLLLNRLCISAVIIPDVSPKLVAHCLSWMQLSSRNLDDFETALMLIEHGIYGAKDGEPILDETVLHWLQHASLDAQQNQARREFGQRLSAHPKITEPMKQILMSF